MNSHRPFTTNEQQRTFNIVNGLRPQRIIFWAVAAALLGGCCTGVYFGLMAGRQIFGG